MKRQQRRRLAWAPPLVGVRSSRWSGSLPPPDMPSPRPTPAPALPRRSHRRCHRSRQAPLVEDASARERVEPWSCRPSWFRTFQCLPPSGRARPRPRRRRPPSGGSMCRQKTTQSRRDDVQRRSRRRLAVSVLGRPPFTVEPLVVAEHADAVEATVVGRHHQHRPIVLIKVLIRSLTREDV